LVETLLGENAVCCFMLQVILMVRWPGAVGQDFAGNGLVAGIDSLLCFGSVPDIVPVAHGD
jgi:hypothetical protein